jgi:hypothetical protein
MVNTYVQRSRTFWNWNRAVTSSGHGQLLAPLTGQSSAPIYNRIIQNLIVDIHEGRLSPGDVPFDGNRGNAHVIGDLGVSVTRSVRQIDLSRPRVHRVQTGCEPIQSLSVIENLIWSRTGGYQRALSVDVLDRHFAAQPQAIMAIVIDRQIAYGTPEKCLLILDVFFGVNMQAQHGLLDQILSVL